MVIPEVSVSQVHLMNQVCYDPNMSTFSQSSSKEGDSPEAALMMDRGRFDAEYLCLLGFLREITEDHQERIDSINKETGRNWRVFEITAMGRAMFQVATSPTKH